MHPQPVYSIFVMFIMLFFKDLMSFSEHTARQTHKNGGLQPPKRPDYGTVGRPIKLKGNSFRLNISPKLSDLYHYDLEISPKGCPKAVKRNVVNEIIRKYKDTTFQGHIPAFDREKNLYSRIKLPVGNRQGAVSKLCTFAVLLQYFVLVYS